MALSRQQLLDSIHPNMRITKSFFKSIYAKEITWPGFSEDAIATLEAAGCFKARSYYESWVNEYEMARNAELKEVAVWYRKECEKKWKRLQEGSDTQRNIQNLTRNELTELCQRLLQTGVIKEPEQFAMAVGADR